LLKGSTGGRPLKRVEDLVPVSSLNGTLAAKNVIFPAAKQQQQERSEKSRARSVKIP